MSKKSLANAAALPSPHSAMLRSLITATVSLVLLSGLSAVVPAQTADKILGQPQSDGRRKAIKRVTSRQATGTITRSADGATGRYQLAATAPNFTRSASKSADWKPARGTTANRLGAGFAQRLRTLTGQTQ